MWNRVADLEELAGLEPGAWEQFARAVVDCAVTGRWPGLYLGEDDHLEARWIINSVVVSATFINPTRVDIYVYDRSSGVLVRDDTRGLAECPILLVELITAAGWSGGARRLVRRSPEADLGRAYLDWVTRERELAPEDLRGLLGLEDDEVAPAPGVGLSEMAHEAVADLVHRDHLQR